jgi:small subunit ribosomal protein S16
MGKKRQPFYRVVAADKDSPRDGRFIETIGYYNPKAKSEADKTNIDEERVSYWLNVGAIPTDTVRSILSKRGILFKRDLKKQGLSEQQIEVKLEERNKLLEAQQAAEAKAKESQQKSKETEDKKEEAQAQQQEAEKTEAKQPSEEQEAENSKEEAKDAASEGDQNKEDSTS